MRKIEEGRDRALVQFLLDDPEPMLYHNEPIRRDGTIVGYITSAMYGHTLGAAVGLGYVSNRDEMSDDFILSGSYEIEVAGNRIPAKPSLQALYDPQGLRVRA
jgi:4-methylaminobutanoate oxidase (formaldehyde-forming)